jgi:hypothetical protein
MWQIFAATLAKNLLGSKTAQAPPVEKPTPYSTSGFRRPTGRRGSQAVRSRPAPVELDSSANFSVSLKNAVHKRMLRETKDTVKVAKATKA